MKKTVILFLTSLFALFGLAGCDTTDNNIYYNGYYNFNGYVKPIVSIGYDASYYFIMSPYAVGDDFVQLPTEAVRLHLSPNGTNQVIDLKKNYTGTDGQPITWEFDYYRLDVARRTQADSTGYQYIYSGSSADLNDIRKGAIFVRVANGANFAYIRYSVGFNNGSWIQGEYEGPMEVIIGNDSTKFSTSLRL